MSNLKSLAYDILLLAQNLPGFWLWRRSSLRNHGERRWIDTDYGRIMVRSRDYRAYTIAKTRGTQKDTVKKWQSMVELKKPSMIIDVGANYGEFSSVIVNLDIPMLIVEPNPWIFECLKETFADQPHVRLVNAAITDMDGDLPFFINPDYSGISSLSQSVINANWFFGRNDKVQKVIVKTYRLDSLVSSADSIAMKVDVEGFEYSVMKSSMSVLNKCTSWFALLEFYPPGFVNTGSDINEVWRFYRQYNHALPEIVPQNKGMDIVVGTEYVVPTNHNSTTEKHHLE